MRGNSPLNKPSGKPETRIMLARQTDPDDEERKDQRTGNWIVVAAYGGSGLLIIGGLLALAKFL